jgi:hypothetical protein
MFARKMTGVYRGVGHMKLMALLGAGAMIAGTLGAVPAEAQRYRGDGYHGSYYGGGRYGGGYRHHYRPAYRGYYRPGYRARGYYGRPRVVCRLRPGYYGPVRRCFRAY